MEAGTRLNERMNGWFRERENCKERINLHEDNAHGNNDIPYV